MPCKAEEGVAAMFERTVLGVATKRSCGKADCKFRSCNGVFTPPFNGVGAFCRASRFSAS